MDEVSTNASISLKQALGHLPHTTCVPSPVTSAWGEAPAMPHPMAQGGLASLVAERAAAKGTKRAACLQGPRGMGGAGSGEPGSASGVLHLSD